MTKPNIFPISFSEEVSRRLVMKYCGDLVKERTRYRHNVELSPYASMDEHGNVTLSCHYSFDDGFVSGGGGLFDPVTVRPWTDQVVSDTIQNAQLEYAMEVFYRRKREEELAEIEKIKAELFG